MFTATAKSRAAVELYANVGIIFEDLSVQEVGGYASSCVVLDTGVDRSRMVGVLS